MVCSRGRKHFAGRIPAASFTVVNIVYERKQRIRPGGGDVYMRISRAKRARLRLPGVCIRSRLMVRSALLMNGREFAFQRVLLRLGLEEAARGVFRDVVKFAVRHSAQISRITDAVTDVDAVILKSNIAELLDPLPAFGTIHLHISS
jgi:hypothetical protein